MVVPTQPFEEVSEVSIVNDRPTTPPVVIPTDA
jgi:hypothetical protein